MLTPCSDCHRHVRAIETRCPFCGGEPEVPARSGGWVRGATRAAIFYFGASLAACGGGEPAEAEPEPEIQSILQPYGAPPEPPPEPPVDPDTPPPETIAAPYGAPPMPPPEPLDGEEPPSNEDDQDEAAEEP